MSQRTADFGMVIDDAQTDSDQLVGVDLGGVRIERLIGEGGMGRVYQARQTNPARTVAVKVMRVPSIGDAAQRRFSREVDALARLRHPGIAQIFTAGCHRMGLVDVPYYVMECIPGAEPLVHACDRRGLPLRSRLELLLEVCDAVAHGHASGIVHRDLKPANILVDAAGRPKIIDFGIARMDGSGAHDAGPRTETGQFIGTRPYMAPEQFSERRVDIDARTDVHAIGVVMHELLTGRLPYDVAGKSLVETARVVQEFRPARLAIAGVRSADRGLARGAEAIAARCLRKVPAERYASAADVAADLRRLLAGEPLASVADRVGCRGFGAWCRRRSAAIGAVAVLGAALAVLASTPPRSPHAVVGTQTSPLDGGGAGVSVSDTTEWLKPPSREIRFGPLDDDWDRHVVSMEGVERYTERHAGATTFIRPTVAGREGVITLRFDMPFTIQDATLTAPLAVWTTGDAFPYDPGARAAVDVSADGETWTTIVELRAGAGGFNTAPHDIGRFVSGGTHIWVRVRLTGTKEWPGDGLIFAQFLRTDPKERGSGFLLAATGPRLPVLPDAGP